tara:strand:- start:114 stop:2189 length:2076 start_codon:yes stop_codon:yes gene_type:complete
MSSVIKYLEDKISKLPKTHWKTETRTNQDMMSSNYGRKATNTYVKIDGMRVLIDPKTGKIIPKPNTEHGSYDQLGSLERFAKGGRRNNWTEEAKKFEAQASIKKEEPKEKEMSATEKFMAQVAKYTQLKDTDIKGKEEPKPVQPMEQLKKAEPKTASNPQYEAQNSLRWKWGKSINDLDKIKKEVEKKTGKAIDWTELAKHDSLEKYQESQKPQPKEEPEITGKPGEKATPPPVLSDAEKRISVASPKLLQEKEEKKKVVSAELKKAFDKLQFEEKDAISQWGREKAKLDPSDPKYKELEDKQRAEFQKWHKMFNPGIDVPFDMYQQQYEPETYKKAQASMAAKEKLPEAPKAESVVKPPEKQFERVISQMQSAQTPKVDDTPRPAPPSPMAGQVQGPGPAGSGTGYQWEQNFQPNVIPTSQQTTSQRDMARFDPEIQDLLSRKKRYAQEGLSKREEEGFRSKMIQSMRQEQKMAGLRAGGALRGMEGASAAAAARRHQQAGQGARGQIEQAVLEKDQAASRAGIEDYMKTLGEVKAFDASQFEADQMRKMLEDMYNKQMGAAGSGGGGGGGGSSSNFGQDTINFVRHTGDEAFGEVEKFLDMGADVVGGDFRAIPEYLEEIPIIGGAAADVVNVVGKPLEKVHSEFDRAGHKYFNTIYEPASKVLGKAGDLGKKFLNKTSDILSDLNPFD